MIKTKEDFLKLLKDDTNSKYYDACRYLSSILPYEFIEKYGKGTAWISLNESGKSDEEILDFLWPIVQKQLPPMGIAYYTYEDDCCSSTEVSEILWNNGYYSDRG